MTKYITEILDELNEDPAKITQYKDAFVVKTVFQYAYNPELSSSSRLALHRSNLTQLRLGCRQQTSISK